MVASVAASAFVFAGTGTAFAAPLVWDTWATQDVESGTFVRDADGAVCEYRIGDVVASTPEAQAVLDAWLREVDLFEEMDLEATYAEWGYSYDAEHPGQPGGFAVHQAVVIQAATEALDAELERHGSDALVAVSGQTEC